MSTNNQFNHEDLRGIKAALWAVTSRAVERTATDNGYFLAESDYQEAELIAKTGQKIARVLRQQASEAAKDFIKKQKEAIGADANPVALASDRDGDPRSTMPQTETGRLNRE
ncbi:MAG: hypothetical protein PVJ60_02250 [Phycisphaerales bacterium]|jgi:hypothetical protein